MLLAKRSIRHRQPILVAFLMMMAVTGGFALASFISPLDNDDIFKQWIMYERIKAMSSYSIPIMVRNHTGRSIVVHSENYQSGEHSSWSSVAAGAIGIATDISPFGPRFPWDERIVLIKLRVHGTRGNEYSGTQLTNADEMIFCREFSYHDLRRANAVIDIWPGLVVC
jgi:hypothetical protein